MSGKLKSALSVILIAVIVVALSASAQSPSAASVDYVAFGDSVAAGVRGGVNELGSGSGYTDIIAANLKTAGALGSFSEDFCTSGMTAARLAEDTAVLRDKSSSEYELVKNAEIATLTIGANDLLAPLYAYIRGLDGQMPDMDRARRELTDVASSAGSTGGPQVEAYIETILGNILSANPDIKIYVMGYYNPLPVISYLAGVDLNAPLKVFNSCIKEAADKASGDGSAVFYVDTMSAMGSDDADYLVASDIHPTEAGYKIIAYEFWKQIAPDVPEAASVTALPTKASVLVDGAPTAFEAYNIFGSNYFKLRDLAYVLSGTDSGFGVSFDASERTIHLTSGKAYAPVGGEMAAPDSDAEVTASFSVWTAYLDGREIGLSAYNIDGSNYFRLRDLGSAIDFGVGWDADTATIKIDTSAGYSE